MDKAVERIKKAKENDERVFIFGDYDVDGVTSTSILMHFFKTI
jgi:single-stranded-DNA-specific exonuclease